MFKDLTLKKVYDSEQDNIICDFYVPTLSSCKLYKRVTGYFSSGSLLVAAKGIISLIRNNGKMDLISSANLSYEDFAALRDGLSGNYISNSIDEIIKYGAVDDLDHLKLLSWMVAKNCLNLKIAYLHRNSKGIFHEKFGIMYDEEGSKISFSGSINETAGGWLNNQEEFKVFRSWNGEENTYLSNDEIKFNKYWSGESETIEVVDLTEAIKKNLIIITPDENELTQIEERVLNNYKTSIGNEWSDAKNLNQKKNLYDYQKTAIQNWVDNNYTGIFEMATGTGKTITAIGCIEKVIEKKDKVLIFIAAPQNHLITQWEDELHKQIPDFGTIICNGDNKNWRRELQSVLFNYQNGVDTNKIILTSYDTMSSKDFIDFINKYYSNERSYLLIADEMHNIGADNNSRSMVDIFDMRLGLSATPKRYFDDTGTQKIFDYFGKTVYEYGLQRAIDEDKLTRYKYYPKLVHMTQDEYNKYIVLTKKIGKLSHGNNQENDKYLEMLTFKRAEITKKSKEKTEKFKEIIEDMSKDGDIKYLLIYCQDNDQLQDCQNIINYYSIVNHKLTDKESTHQRDAILTDFSNKNYQAIVAMNCLDEGIDVPATKTAIIMASSGNPRQYVQRRGRVLRKFPGKELAYIYDFIVLPPSNLQTSQITEVEKRILKTELTRVREFLSTAENKLEILNNLSDIMSIYEVY